MSRALEVFSPEHAHWCPIGLHGTTLDYVQSITRTGLDTEHSVGGRLGERGAMCTWCPVSYTHLTLPTICSV
eukprot:4922813-Alexandrium_andersonii.AAC.1